VVLEAAHVVVLVLLVVLLVLVLVRGEVKVDALNDLGPHLYLVRSRR